MPLGMAMALLYLVCVVFYHTHEKRTGLTWLKTSSALRLSTRIAGWVLLMVSLYILGQYLGWARGIPVWLGLLTLMGLSSLLVAVFAPLHHITTGSVSAGIVLITGVMVSAS